ncbi:MAG: TIGR01244 family phosphatase [Enhydrobacter sp.]|nr:MAG: TIGR01244 family phosphatase [Enhydrobacter sp.]
MTLSLEPLDGRVAASGQLGPDDMKNLAAAGYRTVVNNRPDREAMFGQPRTTALRRAAELAGLTFVDLPFSGTDATPDQVQTLADLMSRGDGTIVVFCKSGMRSAFLWGVAAIASGKTLEEVLNATRGAGHNLASIQQAMLALAARARSRVISGENNV